MIQQHPCNESNSRGMTPGQPGMGGPSGFPGGGFPGGGAAPFPGSGFPGGGAAPFPGGGFPGGGAAPFPGGGPGGPAPGGGQGPGAPLSPPPSFVPTQPSASLYAVDPGSIRRCVNRYVYIWQDNGDQYWMYLTHVGRNSISGYRWYGFAPVGFWLYFGLDLRRISQFNCF